jgi:ABC-type dipeptide/oligopeptide/nickel transport system permease subunit
MLTATVIGVAIGLVAGYFGGWVDQILMRCTDVLMAVPSVLLALAFAGLMDGRTLRLHPAWLPLPFLDLELARGVVSLLLVIGLVSWTGMARVVRAQVLSLKERPFVEAARALGCSDSRILLRHILPNVAPVILVLTTLSTAGTVGLEAGLSFLGVGVPPPTPTWGGMLGDGQPYLLVAPWLALPPGVALVLAVLGFNLLGRGLEEALEAPTYRAR